jgi:hypothetical protein
VETKRRKKAHVATASQTKGRRSGSRWRTSRPWIPSRRNGEVTKSPRKGEPTSERRASASGRPKMPKAASREARKIGFMKL